MTTKAIATIAAMMAMTASTATAQTLKVYKGDDVVATYTIGTDADRVEFTTTQAAEIMAMDPQLSSVARHGDSNNYTVTMQQTQDGKQCVAVLDLYDSADTSASHLSEGTYRVAEGTVGGTLSSDNSYVLLDGERHTLHQGTLSVSRTGNTRTLLLDATLDNGDRFTASLKQAE